MMDLKTLSVMLGLDQDGIPLREQKMLFEEIEYLAARCAKAEFNQTLTIPVVVVRSLLRAWTHDEITIAQLESRNDPFLN